MTKPAPRSRVDRYRELYFTSSNTERIIFFSDAVFAIAMTLLVLEIKVPELTSEQVAAGELARSLAEQWPHLFAYVLSFGFIAITWLSHHNIWKFVEVATTRLMWLNIVQLLLVALMPVPTALIALYGPTSRIAPIAYALTAGATGLMTAVVWSYTYRQGLLDARVEPDLYVMIRRHLLLSPAVFAVSCGIALFDPLVAMISWAAISPVSLISNRQMLGRLRRKDIEDAPA